MEALRSLASLSQDEFGGAVDAPLARQNPSTGVAQAHALVAPATPLRLSSKPAALVSSAAGSALGAHSPVAVVDQSFLKWLESLGPARCVDDHVKRLPLHHILSGWKPGHQKRWAQAYVDSGHANNEGGEYILMGHV